MIVSFWVDCGLREQIYAIGIEHGMTEQQAEDFCCNFEPEIKVEVRVDLKTGDYYISKFDGRELKDE